MWFLDQKFLRLSWHSSCGTGIGDVSMKLTFKRREVKDLHQLATLVAENAEAIEPGLQIVGSNLNLGRASVELVGIDSAQRPVLITLGLTADDAVLLRALEAYAWCLEYPEAVQKVVPATTQPEWPPRVVFVAERLLESFVRKMRLLRFSAVDFFEFRYVEAHGTTGFYLDRVDWDRTESSSPEIAERPARLVHQVVEQPIVEEPIVRHDEPKVVPLAEPIVVPPDEPEVVPRDEPKVVMLHEPKAAPGIVEPAATNGAGSRESAENKARAPVVLQGLRLPPEPPRGHKPREETVKPRHETVPQPAAPAAARASHAETKPGATADPRVVLQGLDLHAKSDVAKGVPSRNSGSRSDLGSKSDLAPTWRKFLDKLTGTFDTRPAPQLEGPRAGAPPAAPTPRAVQPFAADLEISPQEVAPDEVFEESHDATGELTEKQRSIFKGLTLPDNGELAPQWRKFLDHPALDETKIAVVRGYLQREFPMCSVYDFYDFQRNAQVFQLQDNQGKVTQLITMTAEFFDTHRDLEIRAWIEKHRLAHAMRQAGQAGVLVSQAGLQIEKR